MGAPGIRAALLLLLMASAVPDAVLAAERLRLAPCEVPEIPGETLRCGIYEVFEDRAAAKGRKIPLRVVVVSALEPPALPDAVIYFEGGPGASVVASGADVLQEMAALRRKRDIVLVDVRGTGGSRRLDCPHEEQGRAAAEALETFLEPAAIRRCRQALEKEADLARYTTDAIVDDVDEVRAALGYAQANVMGASYGTRAAAVYARRHPKVVRTLLLSSVLPVDARVPQSLAAHTEQAFRRVTAACAADIACRAAFPDPRADLDAVLKRMERPVEVAIADDEGGRRQLALSRNGVAQTVRYLLYRPVGAREIPALLRRAAAGDLAPLAQRAWDLASGLLAAPTGGLYLSVTCAEDVAFLDPAEAAKQAAGTFVGDLRWRQQRAACAEWPAAKVDAGFLEPVRSDVPTLIFAGELDPATPVEWAERVASNLPNSRLLVVPGGGHVFYGLEGIQCLDALAAQMVEQGSVANLDLDACRRTIKPLPFTLTVD
jgi:pimeloyl-ACP methyl ester carboxylesterase